jgi:hypothetical protein
MISWHDGSDKMLSANDHAPTCEAMINLARSKGHANTRSNTKFFIVPGAAHGGGASYDKVNWLDTILNWFEKIIRLIS